MLGKKIDVSPLVLPTGRKRGRPRNDSLTQLEAVDLMRDLLAALGWVEFWEHHRDCKPLSAAGCTCHYIDVLFAVRAIRAATEKAR